MTAQLVANATPPNGLQPVDVGRHLAGIADLIELCFKREMDAGGLSFVRELRWLSRFAPALQALNTLGIGHQIWTQGFVWLDAGRVAGSVSTQPSSRQPGAWLIANVAVHPDYRRQGIGLALVRATLDLLRQRGARQALLQVDDDNLAAIELYRRLGFESVAVHSLWTRPPHFTVPPPAPSPFDIRLLEPRAWAAQFELAGQVRAEGLAWDHPLRPADFRPSAWRWLAGWLNGDLDEHWAVSDGGRLIGSLTVRTDLAEGDRLIVLVQPDHQGQLERPLLAHGLRRLGSRPWAVRVEHPTDDVPAARILNELNFHVTRTLRWMRAAVPH